MKNHYYYISCDFNLSPRFNTLDEAEKFIDDFYNDYFKGNSEHGAYEFEIIKVTEETVIRHTILPSGIFEENHE